MIVLDTHAWLWFVDEPTKLSKEALSSIETAIANQQLYVSSISTWEILLLEKKGRLKLAIPAEIWLERCEKTNLFSFIPIDNAISRISVSLNIHADPADRFIAATAIYLGATLITKDRKLRATRKIETIW
ncbi:MAG: type II toxin-antitoxin system VapC family toxin [Kiritimatiellae bacterium]|nr:type II toxin-antitoxin system VapC family toxin [Kiritimatiellia bacterium]